MPGTEGARIFQLLVEIERMADRPEVKPKAKLRQCGAKAREIRRLVHRAAMRTIQDEENYWPVDDPDLAPLARAGGPLADETQE